MKFTSILQVACFLNQQKRDSDEFTARAIEELPGYLGETNARELRRLRQIGIAHYKPTDKKGVYKLCLTEKDWMVMKKWIKEQLTKELSKDFLGDSA